MIVFLLIVVITAFVLEKISLRLPIKNVGYRIESSVTGTEQGEEFRIVTTVENRTKHNIPYLRLKEEIPAGVHLCDGEELDFNGREHVSTLFVHRRERVRRSVRALSYTRGLHFFPRCELSFGDFLGLREFSCEREAAGAVLVYPRRIESERLNRVLGDVLGEIAVQSFLFEDPMLVRGYRDYTGREPLRAVSFTQSAKRMQLTVKEFDHTRTPVANIILDMEFYGDFEHYFDQREAQVSVVRMICESFERRGTGYRIITNMCYPDMQTRGVNVIGSEGCGGFCRILDILSVAAGVAICPTGELLSYAKAYCGGEGAFLYVAQRDCEEVRAWLAHHFAGGEGMLYTFYGSEYEECYREAGRILAREGERKGEGAA